MVLFIFVVMILNRDEVAASRSGIITRAIGVLAADVSYLGAGGWISGTPP
jgi:NADH:ubiquinone oxidoreductase subunit 6 (subunit J)